jgi:hypothetical protein
MSEERSLAGEPAAIVPSSPSAEHPLGTPNPASGDAPLDPPAVSIIDTILQLDDYLSADVRRAEKTARFCTKPWLEADIDELAYELDSLTDATGNPLPRGETALGEQARTAEQVALEIQTLQAEYGAAFVSVRMGQLASDEWQAFRAKWREVIEGPPPYSNEFYDALIEASALRPKITAAQAAGLRQKLGDPQMDELAQKAWDVNTKSGVSIPKSPLSSHVLRRAVRAQS